MKPWEQTKEEGMLSFNSDVFVSKVDRGSCVLARFLSI